MTSFKEIYENIQKEYNFRIKSVIDITTKMDIIERVLAKYDLIELGKVQKTIMQNHPLDFTGIDNSEVWILDTTLGIPITAYALQLDLVATLNISENFLVVRSDNEPRELETARIDADREFRKEYPDLAPAPLLSTDSEYPEESLDGSLIVGNAYNAKFLDFLAQQAAVRAEKSVYKTGSGLFSWLEGHEQFHETDGDFNADIKDAPKVHPHWEAKRGEPKDTRDIDEYLSQYDNLDDDAKKYTKRFIKKNGNDVEASGKGSTIR